MKEEEGSKAAVRLRQYKADSAKPIAAILILNTIANTVGAAGVGRQATLLWGDALFGWISAGVTLLILIFAEIIPKTIGTACYKGLMPFTSSAIRVLIWVMYPLVMMVRGITRCISPKMADEEAAVSMEEVTAMANLAEEEGEIDESDNKIIQNLFKLDSLKAWDAMTPRVVAATAPETMTLKAYYKDDVFLHHSRIPVYAESPEFITGYILRTEALQLLADDKFDATLGSIRRDIAFFNDDTSLGEIWDRLLAGSEQIAAIIDEYGCFQGIITLEDMIETILGLEIIDEHDEVSDMQQYARERWHQRQKAKGGKADTTVPKERKGTQKGKAAEDGNPSAIDKAAAALVAAILLPMASCSDGDIISDAGEATVIRNEIFSQWRQEQAERFNRNDETGVIVCGGDSLKYSYTVFGEKPADGRSLWISLHGGGQTAPEVNDSQWNNQKRLYRPAEGVYLCPRAPWDTWDMWFQAPLDSLLEELAATMTAVCEVNPDKIYLLGYSAGGDGVWRLAPRLADHWAAASMMAGHPGEISLLNLRNLPFQIWMGELDAAYNRNREAVIRGEILDSLHRADSAGYLHECHIIKGKGHWMEHADTAALPWMAAFTRNPYPRKIVWRQEEVTRRHFYWLEAPEDEICTGKTVEIKADGNAIDILHCDYSSLTLWFNDDFINLNKAVTVTCNGKVLYDGKVERRISNLKRSLKERRDPRYMFSGSITLQFEE